MHETLHTLRKERLGLKYRELAAIAAIGSCDQKYYDSLREEYSRWTMTKAQLAKRKNPHAFDLADPKQFQYFKDVLGGLLGGGISG
jgi:hypothetical protein